MGGFNFERDLPHQQKAVKSVLAVFDGLAVAEKENKLISAISNPVINFDDWQFEQNIIQVQQRNYINSNDKKFRNNAHVLDISMETGTGKTYTYTKTIFELNKELGLNKFIIIVPTLSIKAGTVNFLRSFATKEHFRADYAREIKTYVVESQKAKKKKATPPQEAMRFIDANNSNSKYIHVMIINSGMINSDAMSSPFDGNLLDLGNSLFDCIAKTSPVTIIDEPHKFATANKTWGNIQKFNSQLVLRYGATFNDDYQNLIYELNAIDAFNQDLVKGIVAHTETFESGKNAAITLKDSDGKEASFELNIDNKKTPYKLTQGSCLSSIHNEMKGVTIEKLNKSTVALSNGLELKRGDRINPYSYSESLQDKMITQAISKHFELERDFMTRDVRIKPITLFFIDNIENYRGDGDTSKGNLTVKFESLIKAHIEKQLKIETNQRYKVYLEKSLKDITLCHGGYFSKDNSDSDDKIVKEVEEILHDKESLLDIDNPRRFIFSKWTLREGWDNPNVFQICKLRSSGSQTSKLQEVGRGLRLPVNEYMSRIKNESFDLHYYVDFTENDFINKLIADINRTVIADTKTPNKVDDDLIQKIRLHYDDIGDDSDFLESLDDQGIINRKNEFKDNGYDKLQQLYPMAFKGKDNLKDGKIKNATSDKKKATIRNGKYDELKELWETINQKVILEYKVDNESEFASLFKSYLSAHKDYFKPQGTRSTHQRLNFKGNTAFFTEESSVHDTVMPISVMPYKEFLVDLATSLLINIKTLHTTFYDLREKLDIRNYLSQATIRAIRSAFNKYLLDQSFSQYQIGYKKITNSIHPTAFTNSKGEALSEVTSSALGVNYIDGTTPSAYLFNEIFYDSEIEKENIVEAIKEVVVFTKIPKNSIKIPVAGGGTYSPDFAYVVNFNNGEKSLNLVIESKDKDKRDLLGDETKKIEHAQQLFNSIQKDINVKFKTQFRNNKVLEIIKECHSSIQSERV